MLALATLGCGGMAGPRPEPARAVRDGITVERIVGPPADGLGDGLVTLVRIDMRHRHLTLVTAESEDGVFRPAPEWAARAGLVAGINAALFEPDGRPTALYVEDGVERSPDDARFGGLLAFDPIDPSDAPFVLTGRDCPGVDVSSLRSRYRNVVANYRLLGCSREPIAWLDEDRYSSAAFGVDREGRFVLVHSTTPYRMTDLARTLADPSLGLVAVHYVEGGPKATVHVETDHGPMTLIGSRDEDAHAADRRGPRPIPNVLGVVPR